MPSPVPQINFTISSFSVDTDLNTLTLNSEYTGEITYREGPTGKLIQPLSSFTFDRTISRASLSLNLITRPTILIKMKLSNWVAKYITGGYSGGVSGQTKIFQISAASEVPLIGDLKYRINEVYNFLCETTVVLDSAGMGRITIDAFRLYGDSAPYTVAVGRGSGIVGAFITSDTMSKYYAPSYPLNKYHIVLKDAEEIRRRMRENQALGFQFTGLTSLCPLVSGTTILTKDNFPWDTISEFDVNFHRRSVDGTELSLSSSNSNLDIFECNLLGEEEGTVGTVGTVGTGPAAEITAETFLWATDKWDENKTGSVSYNKRVPSCVLSSEKITPIRFPHIIDLNGRSKLKIEICHSTTFDDSVSSPSNEWFVLVTFAVSADSFWDSEKKISLPIENLTVANKGKLSLYEEEIDLASILPTSITSSSKYINIALAKESRTGDKHVVSNIYFSKIYLG